MGGEALTGESSSLDAILGLASRCGTSLVGIAMACRSNSRSHQRKVIHRRPCKVERQREVDRQRERERKTETETETEREIYI